MNKVFNLCITVKGSFWGSFVFEDNAEQAQWMLEELPKLRKQYGELKLSRGHLPGLKVGDKCEVWGEGSDEFTIRKLIKRGEYQYSFLLDAGWTEDVAKCYKVLSEK